MFEAPGLSNVNGWDLGCRVRAPAAPRRISAASASDWDHGRTDARTVSSAGPQQGAEPRVSMELGGEFREGGARRCSGSWKTLAKPTLAQVKVLVVCKDFGFGEFIVWVF